jgi:hypothetical protein
MQEDVDRLSELLLLYRHFTPVIGKQLEPLWGTGFAISDDSLVVVGQVLETLGSRVSISQ